MVINSETSALQYYTVVIRATHCIYNLIFPGYVLYPSSFLRLRGYKLDTHREYAEICNIYVLKELEGPIDEALPRNKMEYE